MRRWKKVAVGSMVFGILACPLVTSAWAEPSADTKALIAEHRQAATEAQKKVAFHEEMEKNFLVGRGGGKIDMVGHCRYWANYYRKLAVQEEQAAQELEQKGP